MENLIMSCAPLIVVTGGGLIPGIPSRLARLRRRTRLTRFSHRQLLFGGCAWFCCGLYATRRYGWMQTRYRRRFGLALWALVALVTGTRQTVEVVDAD
ncbi:MAG TPA: hypothetical protein VJ995_08490 [Geothermobacteraceae bacterium]|nr:hypothetical protein [Geothermobacteraceae bacterium]